MTEMRVDIVPEEVHRALCARAASRGRSPEAELLAIVQDNVQPEPARSGPESGMSIVDALAAAFREAGVTDGEIDAMQKRIDEGRAEARRLYKPFRFE